MQWNNTGAGICPTAGANVIENLPQVSGKLKWRWLWASGGEGREADLPGPGLAVGLEGGSDGPGQEKSCGRAEVRSPVHFLIILATQGGGYIYLKQLSSV